MLTPYPIRILGDAAQPAIFGDLNQAGAPPQFYRGTDIEIDLGIGLNGELQTGLSATGAGGIASVTCEIFAVENDTNAPMMSCTVLAAQMNLGLTQVEWTNDTTPFQHAAFIFPNAQTAISLNGGVSADYWLKIFATSTDATPKIIPLVEGNIIVKDGPVNTLSVAPLPGVKIGAVAGQSALMLLDPTTNLYHAVTLVNDSGVVTLQVSDTTY